MQSKSWLRLDAHWNVATPFIRHRLPLDLKTWLLSKDSLTQRLIEHSAGRFRVQLLEQGWQLPLPSEAAVLNLPSHEYAFVRQVQLLGGDTPWVYARTVIPIDVAHGRLRGLTHLGNRPLGAVLFSNPTMRRGDIQVAAIPAGSGLNKLAHQRDNECDSIIWGRRSQFHLYNLPLLVSEIFLDNFPARR